MWTRVDRRHEMATKEDGASAVEYGLLVAGIAALLAMIVWAFGGVVVELFTDTCDGVHAKASTTATC